jgi:enoyl-CoA hydratase/carnithine racemase
MTSGRPMVYLQRREQIAEVVFNRPEMLNAANWQCVNDFCCVLDELEGAKDVRAVIVRGEGRAFSTGIDLKALAAGELQLDWFRRFDESVRRLERLDAITIAKIHGYCMGGGLQIALGCDLRISTPEATFGLPAVLEALIPGMGTYRLPRFIGLGRARRMVLSGEMISAEEALRIGLVDWVVPAGGLDEKTESVIGDLLKGSAVAQKYSKKLVTDSFDSTFEKAFSSYLDYQQLTISSEQHKNAMDAYRARKK